MKILIKNHPTRKNTRVTHNIPNGFDQVYDDLILYSGTFSFILGLRDVMNRYGKLSDKQWAAVAKCFAPKPVVDPNAVAVASCFIPITLSASSARYIAKTNQWNFNPRTLIVTQIKSTNRRGFVVRAKVDWTGNVSSCRCCGKALSDWKSQATGVGPYCVKRTGIAYVKTQADVARFKQEMEVLASQLGEFEVMIKDWGIESGMSDLQAAIGGVNTKTIVELPQVSVIKPPMINIPIEHFTWDPSNGLLVSSREDSKKYIDFLDMPEMIQVFNNLTQRAINFQRRLHESKYSRYKSTNPDYPVEVIFE